MPVLPIVDDAVVRRSGLLARVVREEGGLAVAFRNPSHLDLHFGFAVPGLGPGVGDTPRSTVRARSETRVALEGGTPTRPLPLLRVVVRDIRAGVDAGHAYALDPDADAGWFALATEDGSAPLPRERLFARVAPVPGGGARVRFRSRLLTPVHFRFLLPGYQGTERENPAMTLPPGTESELEVPLDRPPDPRLALARVRVFEVSHNDE